MLARLGVSVPSYPSRLELDDPFSASEALSGSTIDTLRHLLSGEDSSGVGSGV